ncbi:DUF5130 domain-containing protein [Nocardia donostiensis]|uniref:DUF5130 domain-containing protein n=1 Tax=Nocardia donostiensis TaxID=1538463 RepID=A0A1V2TA06_9NOCA|nr:DUF5130 domain-containing protein [Nocardia donostiensis]ONM46330.1 DUF5130 domain-containing protein [Nocardia donostiensis]OQS18647.1 DUF5130 domain-containing protein [Nocardia donostiensis]
MASSKWPAVVEADLPRGYVITSSGRVSGVHEAGDVFREAPFSDEERLLMDNVLIEATRATKVRFNVYIGDLDGDPAAAVDTLFPTTPEAARSVLIAVSPNDRAVEVRSGRDVADRVTDRVCQLGVTAALSSMRQGQLIDGLVSAVRVMAAAIGR